MTIPVARKPELPRPPPSPAAAVLAFPDIRPHCASCGVRVACLPDGLEPDDLRALDAIADVRLRVRKRSALFRHGDPFRSLYAIRVGTFKTVVLVEDGREQVTGYHIGGEIVGLDGVGEGTHVCEAVALEDSEVCVLPYERLDELAGHVAALRHNVYRALARDGCRAHAAMFMLGSMRAEERVATFLLDLAARYHARGYSPNEFVLRMTRDETASYLGLTLETVSRLFSRLQGEGLMQVQGRSIKLLDSHALRHIAERSA